jgi:hypothetical protein
VCVEKERERKIEGKKYNQKRRNLAGKKDNGKLKKVCELE